MPFAEVSQVTRDVVELSAFGTLMWVLRHVISVTVPGLNERHKQEVEAIHRGYAETAEKDREMYRAEASADRKTYAEESERDRQVCRDNHREMVALLSARASKEGGHGANN